MWPLDFISEADFMIHIEATIHQYGNKLKSFDLIVIMSAVFLLK